MDMPLWMALCVGIGLSAASGFRVFIPPLALGLAGVSGQVALPGGLEWMSSTPALVAFGAAAALEVGAYYVPWVDNALDAVASPLALAAGTLMTAGLLSGQDPLMQWALAIVGGGGTAALVQGATVAARAGSTMTTAGFGNAGVSTAEAGFATGLSALAVMLPLVAVGLVVAGVVGVGRFIVRRMRDGQRAQPS